MADTENLSASNIRFLLVMKHLSDCGEQPGCVRLTKELNRSRPSVHKMMKALDEKGMLNYEKRSVPAFTSRGLQTAERYAEYHRKICELLMPETAGSDEVCTAVCALLAELPERKLNSLLTERMDEDHE